MLEENQLGCVIDCGLGSLTSGLQEYLKSYSLTNPVVWIMRDMNEIKLLLKLGDRSARLLENGDPSHRKCSNFEFYNLEENFAESQSEVDGLDRSSPTYAFKLRAAQADFSQFVKFITGLTAGPRRNGSPFSLDVPVDLRLYTHA